MNIQELGYQKTPLGDLTLRRRTETRLQDQEVFEVKLGDEYLMSSLFTESERQLATLGLESFDETDGMVLCQFYSNRLRRKALMIADVRDDKGGDRCGFQICVGSATQIMISENGNRR